MILLVALGSCAKIEDKWNDSNHMRAKNSRNAIAQQRLCSIAGKLGGTHEDQVDRDRSGLTLAACDSIARMYSEEMSVTLRGELIPELANLISVLSTEYRTQRDEFTSDAAKARRKDELWNRFGGGNENIIDPELFRIFDAYPYALAAIVYDYVIDTLLFSGGTRIHNGDLPVNEHEEKILNLFESEITWGNYQDWWVTYKGEYYYYIYYYAIDPANYHDAKNAGLPTPTLEEMKELYPPEKIAEFIGKASNGKNDLQLFQEWSLTQANYLQADSKPVAIQDNKK